MTTGDHACSLKTSVQPLTVNMLLLVVHRVLCRHALHVMPSLVFPCHGVPWRELVLVHI